MYTVDNFATPKSARLCRGRYNDSVKRYSTNIAYRNDIEKVVGIVYTFDKDKSGTAVNDATTDKIAAADYNHINEEPRTSIMSIMSIMSNTQASHSGYAKKDLAESIPDQPAKYLMSSKVIYLPC